MSRTYTGKIHVGQRRVTRANGDVYVYERHTQYDRETQKTVTLKNKLLGKLDPETGEIVPTRPKSRSKKKASASIEHACLADILDLVARETGIDKGLESAFGTAAAQKIATIARYLIATDGAAIPRMEAWQVGHPTPYEEGLGESACSELFDKVGKDGDGQQKFFASRAARLETSPSIAFDSTTVSTYSSGQAEARQGFNKDGDGLDTVKLLTLYSVNDRQPVAFAKQPGNVPDVISIQNAIRQLQCFDIDKPVVVTDNGFYSQANMAEFARNSMKFLTLASPSTLWIREIVDELRDRLDSVSSVCSFDTSVHCASKMVMKELSVVRQRSRGGIAAGEAETFSRRLYVHVCYSRDRATKDEQRLVNDLFELKRLVEAGEQLSPAGEKKAEKFLHCSTVGRGGKLKVAFRDEAFREARKYFGFFALVSNEVKDAEEALKSYRLREKIEELFNVQKNGMDGSRPRVWHPDSLQGRLFVQFVALGYHCYLTKRIGEIKERLGTEKDGKTKTELDLEVSLKKWLEARSLIQVLEWFDCVKTTSVMTPRGMRRWSTESVKRDQLFLKLLGI